MANFDIFSDTTPKNLVKRPAGPTIAALRTALSTYSASTYTTAALNAMAKNDMVYAATVYGLTIDEDLTTPAEDALYAKQASISTTKVKEVWTGSSTIAGLVASTEPQRNVNVFTKMQQDAYPVVPSSTTVFQGFDERTTWLAEGNSEPASGLITVNGGISGTNSTNWLTSGDTTKLVALAPDICRIGIGSNDYQSNRPVATYKSNVLAKVEEIHTALPNCIIVLYHQHQRLDVDGVTQGLYPWAQYGTALQEIATLHPDYVVFVNNATSWAAAGFPGSWLSGDNIHLNNLGHAKLAEFNKISGLIPDSATVPPTQLPAMVDNVTLAPISGGLAVSWQPVTGATGYTIEYRANSTGGYSTAAGTNPAGTNLAGLTNGTPYQVRVFATNGNGNGLRSVSKVDTPAAPLGTTYTSDTFGRTGLIQGSNTDAALGGTSMAYEGTGTGFEANGTDAVVVTAAAFTLGKTMPGKYHGIEVILSSMPTGNSLYINLNRTSVASTTARYVAYFGAPGTVTVQENNGGTSTIGASGTVGTVTVGVPFELRHRIDPNNASQDLIEFLIGGAIVWSYTDTTPLTATFLAAISALSSLTGVGIASVRWIDYT